MSITQIENIKKNLTLNLDKHQTKTKLIEPILQFLGYDLSKSNSVEQKVPLMSSINSKKSIDYLLYCAKGLPIAVLEVKPIKTDLKLRKRTERLLDFCIQQQKNTSSVHIGILTNGKSWIVHDIFQQNDSKIIEFEIEDVLTDSVATLNLIKLSNNNISTL